VLSILSIRFRALTIARALNYAANLSILSIRFIKDLGEIWKLYSINVVPVVKKLRENGVLISDRTIIEKLPKLYVSYLAIYGITIDNVMGAVYDLLLYMARSREEMKSIKKSIEDALGEVAELAKRLEKAKELLRAGNLRGAKDVLKDVLSYDVSRLEKTPWMKPRVEAIISTARQYYDQITQIEEQIERLSKA